MSSPNEPHEALESARIARVFFDEQADRYSRFYDTETRSGAAVLFRLRAKIASEMVNGEDASPLLDLATGTGEITRRIATAGGTDKLTLNDFSEPMLRRCRQTFEDMDEHLVIEWSNRDAFRLLFNLPADTFGAILCLGLIAHTGRLEELLSQCHRVLRPGGLVLVQSSLADHVGLRLVSLYAASPFRRKSHVHHSFRIRDLDKAIASARLQTVEARRFGVCLPFGDRLLGRLNFWIEYKFAGHMRRSGGEVVLKLRKPEANVS